MCKGLKLIVITAVLCMVFAGCGKVSADAVEPLMGIDWFTSYDDAKTSMNGYTLLDERENTEEKIPQKMQDYTGVKLFNFDCDLTLCFTDSGLIGFNYHDIKRNQNYRDWYSTLELIYGLPTEESSGMASWYDNPAGKDTAIYLFNLEEGVQISIYGTTDSPDKSYNRTGDVRVPTPEMRTPIVPVELQTNPTSAAFHEENVATSSEILAANEESKVAVSEIFGNAAPDDSEEPVEIEESAASTTTTAIKSTEKLIESVTESAASTTTTAIKSTEKLIESVTEQEHLPVDHTNDFLLNGLQFYGSPDSERRKMNAYTQLYEYRTEEPNQPWELIIEYENVPYEGKNCESVLCFTSLGLVGVNYFDSNTNDYHFWVQTLTEIYGSASESQYDYTAWSDNPVGNGTMIYVFALEDGVQISFFADDTGSKLA